MLKKNPAFTVVAILTLAGRHRGEFGHLQRCQFSPVTRVALPHPGSTRSRL
jgi:hypothetical protein